MDQMASTSSGTPIRLTKSTELSTTRMRGRSAALVSGLYLERIYALVGRACSAVRTAGKR
jgi:hypothetical protein